MKKQILLLAMLCFVLSIHAQCYLANPTEAITFGSKAVPTNSHKMVQVNGTQGHDYFTFEADTNYTYIFTSIDVAGGFSNSLDVQLTVTDKSQGLVVPGAYNQGFNDDFNAALGNYEALLIWRPTHNDTFRLLVTKYQGGGCQELGNNEFVNIAFTKVAAKQNIAFCSMVYDSLWSNANNWIHVQGTSNQQHGKPSDLTPYHVLLWYQRVNIWQPRRMMVETDTCNSLTMMFENHLVINNSLMVRDSFSYYLSHVGFGSTIEGPGAVSVGHSIHLHQIQPKTLHIHGLRNQKVQLIGERGIPPLPNEIDTLIMDNPAGVEIYNWLEFDWITFRRGVIALASGGINDFRRLVLKKGFDGASSLSHIKSFTKPHFSWGFQDVQYYVGNGNLDTIPIGTGTRYRPICLRPNNWGNYIMEVWYDELTSPSTYSVENTLDHISSLEQWSFDYVDDLLFPGQPLFGNIETVVSLNWDAGSAVNPSYVQDLRVTYLDNNGIWVNKGNNSTSRGWVQSDSFDVPIVASVTLASTSADNPLPIEFSDIEAYTTNLGIRLEWEFTAQEGRQFYIERSLDGNLFEQIDHIAIPDREEASWVDLSPYRGKNHYRIVYVDVNGSLQRSSVVNAIWKSSQVLAISSRVGAMLIFSIDKKENPQVFSLWSMDGKKLFSKSISGNTAAINMNQYPSGFYVARVGEEHLVFRW